jgi:hypothetical protein
MKPMLEANEGRVIIVSSEAGLRPIPDMIPYSCTKSAQISIARGLAELTKVRAYPAAGYGDPGTYTHFPLSPSSLVVTLYPLTLSR